MQEIDKSETNELLSTVGIYRQPALDLYFAGNESDQRLSSVIIKNPELIKEAAARRNLNESLSKLFQKFSDPEMNFDQAVNDKIIKSGELIQIYENLSDFLTDEAHYRLILYLPFALLPDPQIPKTQDLTIAAKRFTGAYLDAWMFLYAGDNDVRTSFTDGDILEPELGKGKTPLVRKAAHLIPELAARNLMDPDLILRVIEASDDQVLIDSTLEIVPLLIDRNLLPNTTLEALLNSANPRIRQKIQEINAYLQSFTDRNTNEKNRLIWFADNLNEFFKSLAGEIAETDAKFFIDHPYPVGTPLSRQLWDKHLAVQNVISRYADKISESLVVNQNLPYNLLRQQAFNSSLDLNKVVSVKGAFQAIEKSFAVNRDAALALTQLFVSDLSALRNSDSPDLKEIIDSGLFHLYNLDLITGQTLKDFGLFSPDFASSNPENNFTPETLTQIQIIQEKISELEHDPLWNHHLYPIILVNGSRIKGYAGVKADLDISIMVRPDISWDQHEKILEMIKYEFKDLPKFGKVVEYWLKETNGLISIRNTPSNEPTIAKPDWGYALIDSLWIGNKSEIKHIANALVHSYLQGKHLESDPGKYSRYNSLRQIERQVILYRLAQKGWQRFYPESKYATPELSKLFDGNTAFWDPKFRRTATQLYLQRVFYPEISDLN